MKKNRLLQLLLIGVINLCSFQMSVFGQTTDCDSSPELEQFIRIGDHDWNKTNTVVVCPNTKVLLDFCCQGETAGTGWSFTFTRPDGTQFPGGTNGVSPDQIVFTVDSTGSNAVNEGVWLGTYTSPSGCVKTTFFQVDVIEKISPYILQNEDNILYSAHIEAFEGQQILLGCDGNIATQRGRYTFYRPDGTALPGGTDGVNENEITFTINSTGANAINKGMWVAVYDNGFGCRTVKNFYVGVSPDISQNIQVPPGWYEQKNSVKAPSGSWVKLDFCCQGVNEGWKFEFTRPDGVTFPGGTNGVEGDQIFFPISDNGQYVENIGTWYAKYTNPSGAVKVVKFDVNGTLDPLIQAVKINDGGWDATNFTVIEPQSIVKLGLCCLGQRPGTWDIQYTRPDGAVFSGGTGGEYPYHPGGTGTISPDQVRFMVDTVGTENNVNEGTWKVRYTNTNGTTVASRLAYFTVLLDGYPYYNSLAVNSATQTLPQQQARLAKLRAQIDEPEVEVNKVDNEFNEDVMVFPNPSSDFINVDVSKFAGQKVDLDIINLDGRSLKNHSVEASQIPVKLSLDGIPNGTMLLKIAADNGQNIVKKIVVFH